MRDYLRKSARWLNLGWFWTGVFLVLPNCGLDTTGIGEKPFQNLDQGDQPWDSAIFCSIEKQRGRRCPTSQDEMEKGIRFSDAAIALNEGRMAPYGLDDTDLGQSHCPDTGVEIVEFEGLFPWGVLACLNCSQIGSTYASATDACRARCYDFSGTTEGDTFEPTVPPDPDVKAFCDANSTVATNGIPPDGGCFPGLCTSAGTPSGASDPRVSPEPIIWTEFQGAEPGPNDGDLERNTPTTGEYDAGAVSTQWIERGNAYVEFAAKDPDQAHAAGLSSVADCPAPCADSSQSYTTIDFAIRLHSDHHYYIVESGTQVDGPDVNGSWGTYSSVDRFRITLQAYTEGITYVIYSKHLPSSTNCVNGLPCAEDVILEHNPTVQYPFRVDTSLRDVGATLVNVEVMRDRVQ